MKNLLLPVLLLIFIFGCNAQNNSKINAKDMTSVKTEQA
jgi:hypothetical protein